VATISVACAVAAGEPDGAGQLAEVARDVAQLDAKADRVPG
jgi:hypothetical protein